MTKKPKILIIGGDAAEALEITYPYFSLLEEGWDVEIAAPTKKVFETVVHFFEPGWDTYVERPGYKLRAHKAFSDVNPDEYDGLVIPGGRLPEYIRTYPEVEKIVRHFVEKNKPIAVICHAPLVLIAYGLVKGRKMTAYGVLKSDVENAGATYVDEPVVVDGNIVSSRAWPDNPYWMREFKKLVKKYLGLS